MGYEEFNNGGVDLRVRKKRGDDGMFRGSALTFGGMVYHGDAPFQRSTLNATNAGANFLYAPRGSSSDIVTLDQDRTADYQPSSSKASSALANSTSSRRFGLITKVSRWMPASRLT